jgi:hypothetical protein
MTLNRPNLFWPAAGLAVLLAFPPLWTSAQQSRLQQTPAPADDALRAAPPLTRLFALDAYTQYELLADPNEHAFRIIYLSQETRAGATLLINGTRHGSDGGGIEVYDPRTGEPLKFEYIGGEEARARKLPGQFVPEDHYIVAQLPRPVPVGGEGRVLIIKTYKDARTYYAEGEQIVWVRALSAMRFGVVLPRGYAFTSANIASQVSTLPDGRLKLSLTNPSGGGSPITIRARKTAAAFEGLPDWDKRRDKTWDDSKTLYDLDAPETHRFRVEQTYSETRKGERVRLSGAPTVDLKVVDLDTAQPLKLAKEGRETVAKLDVPIVNERQSARLKVSGGVADPAYAVANGTLRFQRTVTGLRNTIWLPAGWEVMNVSQPCTLGTNQGRAFVALVNIQQEEGLKVSLTARRGVGANQSQ